MTEVENKIRETIAVYLERFSAGDREGWLDLFAADATMEDPVGTEIKHGREEIGKFWDESLSLADEITLKMVQGPAVIGNEAAWAMEAHAKSGDMRIVSGTIDVMTFDDDGRITTMRAFYRPEDARIL
jgi:steroid delta-isomerase